MAQPMYAQCTWISWVLYKPCQNGIMILDNLTQKERVIFMASVTLENSYVSTNSDMGDSHENAHDKQHKYLQKDEPKILTLTDNKSSDLSTELAIKMAIKQGVKSEDDWEEYNNKLRKDRRKDSYEEYLATIAGNLVKAKRRKLNDKKHLLPKQKREQIAQELASIDRNGGIPIDGSLFYISNSMIYDHMKPEELKNFRQFEQATLTEFYNSKTFKELNPQNIRSELHFDENGSIHLQTQSVWYHKDKRGRMTYAKRAEIKQILIKKYGSEQRLNNYLDVLSYCHEVFDKKKGSKDRIGSPTVASKFWHFRSKVGENMVVAKELKVDDEGNEYPFKHTKAERTTRLEELWRMEQQKALGEIATAKAKEMGVDWHLDTVYTTDGIHRTGANYVEHKQSLQTANAELNHKQKQLQTVKKQVVKTRESLESSYKALTGRSAVTEDGQPLSIENLSKGLEGASRAVKKQVEQAKADCQNAETARDDALAEQQELIAQKTALKQQIDQLKVDKEEQDKQLKRRKQRLQQLEQDVERNSKLNDAIKAQNGKMGDVQVKAQEYDELKKWIGEIPPKHTLSSWIKKSFDFQKQQAKIGMKLLTDFDKVKGALVDFLGLHKLIKPKDVSFYKDGDTTDELKAIVDNEIRKRQPGGSGQEKTWKPDDKLPGE